MLKKKYRVRGRVFSKGSTTLNTPLFSIRIVKNNLPFSRAGFIVSKKVDKRAVMRNRVRRILSSCVEQMYDKISGGYDMRIYPKKEALNKERNVMYKTLEASLKGKGLLS